MGFFSSTASASACLLAGYSGQDDCMPDLSTKINDTAPSPEQIAEALNKRAPKAVCAYCGGADLQVLMNEDGSAGNYAIYQWNNLKRAMPVYAVGCMSCGHPHFFSKKLIDAMVLSDASKSPAKEG